MSLLVIAYPSFSPSDYARIQSFRKDNDPLYGVVEPHVTLVFPVSGWPADVFVAEVKQQAQGVSPFDLVLRSATLNKDAFADRYHVFLAPDEGFGQVIRLHDRLYRAKLFDQWALHIDFIPHVGTGSVTDPLKCLALMREWNREEFALRGHVAALDVVSHENNVVTTLERIVLSN